MEKEKRKVIIILYSRKPPLCSLLIHSFRFYYRYRYIANRSDSKCARIKFKKEKQIDHSNYKQGIVHLALSTLSKMLIPYTKAQQIYSFNDILMFLLFQGHDAQRGIALAIFRVTYYRH